MYEYYEHHPSILKPKKDLGDRFMQYSNKSKNTKSFYIVTAVCLVAIALTSYIAVSKNREDKKTQKSEDPVITEQKESYTDNNSENDEITAEPTEKKAEDIPYTEPEKKEEEPKQDDVKTFVPPVKGKIIKGYSEDTLQYDRTFGDMRIHKAVDISCNENDQIVSVTAGTVMSVTDSASFNKIITVDHGNGYTAQYCGLGTANVAKGDTVAAGDIIGTAKNPPCECLDECHIHIVCMKDGVPFDPVKLYSENN